MQRSPERIAPETTVAEAARRMRDACVGFLPVCAADGKVMGVLTDRDIALRVDAPGLAGSTPVSRVMSRGLIACGPGDELDHALALMGRERKCRLVILDDAGRLAGVISLSDLAQHSEPLRLARLLREIYVREYRVRKARGS
jgi:CBS domain-containing protein